MANRILDNCYVLDTASATSALTWPTNAKIMGIKLIGTEVQLTGITTTNVLVRMTGNDYMFMGGVYFGPDIKVAVLTAGTAWVYFG